MSVASGVEFGDACMAALGQLPQVIGSIQTAIGCATITRASGIAIRAVDGDPVCQSDVIETAADGRIEIRFIDGTAFTLSRDTRVELSEFARDSDGTLRSALLAVTRGTFAFFAGRLATTGSLMVDTPFGSIRSRVQAGGFGMLSLAALTFSLMKEVQAADPNVTFLDDDSITYKDLAHGVFELVTKEAIPRHIIVEDPGETVVLTRKGSSVSLNEVANSPARMEELQAAQQEALANFAKGPGKVGSSAPTFSDPELLPQPINFIPGDSPAVEGLPLPIVATSITVPDLVILPPTLPTPALPTLAITSIGGQIGIAVDNIINAAKANAGVEITGGTSGVQDGRIVTVTIVDSFNHVVYSGTATVTNSTWSIDIDPTDAKSLADGIYTLTADTSNAAGDPAAATRTIRVDETPPTIAIHTVAGVNVVNVNAASTGFAIAGTTNGAENGQPVTVTIVDSSGHVVDTLTTTLTNNSWSVNVSSSEAKLLHDGSYTVTANVSDSAGNPAPPATQAITVDETPPTVTWLPQAECGIEGTAIALGAITATVNSLPGHSDIVQSLVVSGIPAGAVLSDGANCFIATSGNTSINVQSWNLSNLKITPPNDTNFILTVTATDQDANTAGASELVTVAPLAPYLCSVATKGNEGTAIALDLGVMAKSLSGANGDATPNSLNTLVVSDIPVGATLSDGTGLPGHSFTAAADNTAQDVASWNLSSLNITAPAEFVGCFKLTIAASERDSEGDNSATVKATEVVTVAPVGGPGPTFDWNDPANWSGGVVPTLSIDATINAPSNYTVIITGTPDAQAESLTLPHGAVSTDITVRGPLQLAGDLDVSRSGILENDGTLEETANATFIGPITNNGTIIVDPNVYLDVTGPITGIGKFSIDSGTTLEFAPGSKVAPGTTDSQLVYFEQGAGKLIIDDWGKFAGVITGTGITTHLTTTDLIDLTQLPYVEGSMSASVSYNSGTNISTIIFGDGISSNNVTLHFSGNYTTTAWSFTSVNGGAGTEIVDPPTDSGTVTSGATGEIAAASAATTDFANAGGINTSLALDNSQNFTGQIVGFTGDGTAGTGPASQTFPSSPTKSAGDYGTFPMTAAGEWAHTLDNGGASFDEGGTPSTEDSVVAAAITLPSGISIEPPNLAVTAPMQTSFAFDQKPVFDSADAMTIDHEAVMHGPTLESDESIVLSGSDWRVPKNAGPMNGGDTHAHEIDTSPNVALDSGVLKTPESDSGNHSIAGDAGKHAAPMHGAGVHSIAQVGSWETAGTPGDSFHFQDEISDSKGSGIIDVAEPNDIPASESHHDDAAGTHGPLAISEGGETPGALGDSFHFKDEISGSKGSRVTDVAELNDIPASESHHDDAAGTHGPLAISEGGETPGALGDSFHFKDEISGSKGSRVTDVAELNGIPTSMSRHEDAAGTHGPPAISEGAQAIGRPSPEQYPDDEFHVVTHHAPSTLVTHVQHDLIV